LDQKKKEEQLDALSKRLNAAEEKLRGKEDEINKLKFSSLNNLKEGWLNKKGKFFPTWKRLYFALSGVDSKLYYSKSPSEEKFEGMINLKFCFYPKR